MASPRVWSDPRDQLTGATATRPLRRTDRGLRQCSGMSHEELVGSPASACASMGSGPPMLRVVVREGRSEDFRSATELLNRVWLHRVGSERGLRHAAAMMPPDAYRRYWAAEDDGKLVGWATAGIEYQSSERPGFLQTSVAPESRAAGLGTALLERCEVHLAGIGVATAAVVQYSRGGVTELR